MQERKATPTFRFSDAPPLPPGWYAVRRPRAGETQKGIALGPDLLGHDLHYSQGRSVPCVTRERGCPFCRKRKPHWEGYFFVYDEFERKTYIQAVSAGAVRNNWGLRQGLLVRGRRVEVSRDDASDNAKVSLVIREHVSRPDQYPVCPDLRDALSRLWQTALEQCAIGAAEERDKFADEDTAPHGEQGTEGQS
jgi:hypothetical protein